MKLVQICIYGNSMKLLIICYIFVSLSKESCAQIFGRVLPPKGDILQNVQGYNFSQKLDHFSTGPPVYWNQQYFVNESLWSNSGKNSPVFLMVSGESPASVIWMGSGAWMTWANQHGALLLQLEHRFYGQSQPTQDVSVESLRYLTSEQALADVSYFIQQMKSQYNLTSRNKWILFGGSYAGNLVAWARLKYPSQVYGSIASSAPLWATIDFYEYNDVVRTSLDTYSPGCSNQLTRAIKGIQKLLSTPSGARTIVNTFNTCFGFNTSSPYDVKEFYESIFNIIGGAVQYNGDIFGTIDFVCSYLNDMRTLDPIDRLAQLANVTSECLNVNYPEIITYYQATSWNALTVIGGDRQWLYQTCNEFGYYQTSESKRSLFSDTLPLDFFTGQCTDIFGSNFNPKQLKKGVGFTDRNYRGTDIKVDRVVFVQGSIDPWHSLGMVRNPTAQSPLIFIKGASHCQDMMSPDSSDSTALKNARVKIGRHLESWLIKKPTPIEPKGRMKHLHVVIKKLFGMFFESMNEDIIN